MKLQKDRHMKKRTEGEFEKRDEKGREEGEKAGGTTSGGQCIFPPSTDESESLSELIREPGNRNQRTRRRESI